ncbi:hypothetical protein FRC17_007289 [Serendipita sp. 399]|nr:hypothetical protein FRC17_007289 [Serendipita sp. 399]
MDMNTPTTLSLPTEIWFEIFRLLITDDAVFDPDPVSSSHQPHIVLRHWYETTIPPASKQHRATLRTVSKWWKDIVDTIPCPYFQPINPIDDEVDRMDLRTAHKIQLGSLDADCSCRDECVCAGYDYWSLGGSRKSKSTSILAKSMAFIDSLKAEILILPRAEWDALMEHPLEAVRRYLCHIRALAIESAGVVPMEIPLVCPTITLLAIHVIEDTQDHSRTKPLAFPNLSTLQIVVRSEEILEWIGRWEMPSLRYLELTAALIPLAEPMQLSGFLEKVGHSLLSVQLGDLSEHIEVPYGIWDALPNVVSFGTTTLQNPFPPAPPPHHPLRTFSNRDLPLFNRWRKNFMDMIETWPGIRCISDSHAWQDTATDFCKVETSRSGSFDHECVRVNDWTGFE